MITGIDSVNLFSENASKLVKFYKEVLGLKTTGEFEMGEGDDIANVFMFDFKDGSSLSIIDHSEVKGKNPNPQRMMINFEVEDIDTTLEELKKADVTLIADKYHVEGYGWIATIQDPDGNYLQVVQVRSN